MAMKNIYTTSQKRLLHNSHFIYAKRDFTVYQLNNCPEFCYFRHFYSFCMFQESNLENGVSQLKNEKNGNIIEKCQKYQNLGNLFS